MTNPTNRPAPTTEELLETLRIQVAELQSKLASQVSNGSTFKEPKIPTPDKFNGNKKDFKNFKASVTNVIKLQPSRFGSEEVKILFIGTLLTGDALTWFRTLTTYPTTLNDFWTQLGNVFGDPCAEWSARDALKKLKQGKMSCVAYTTKFAHHSLETGYNNEALYQMYHDGLNDSIKDALAQAVNVPEDLANFVEFCIKIDNRQYSRRMEKSSGTSFGTNQQTRLLNKPAYRPVERVNHQTSQSNGPTPMQLDAVFPTPGPLPKEEKERRRNLGLCLYCGNSGHLAKSCPKKSPLNSKVQGQ